MNIAEIREKYPQYEDLSDEQLAQGLHSKFYSDMEFSDFSQKIGLTANDSAPQDAPQEAEAAEPKQSIGGSSILGLNLSENVVGSDEDRADYAKGMMRQGAQGVSLGFADEAEAKTVSMLSNKTYKEARDEIRELNAEFSKENPVASTAANLAGGLATGGVGLAKSLAGATGKTIKGKIAAGTVTGAELGAVAGAGVSDAELIGDDKQLGDFAKDVGLGALIGGATGAAGGGITGVLQKKVQSNQALKKILADEPSGEVATKQLVNGKIVDHPQAQTAVKQGLDGGDVYVMRSSSTASKRGMLQMLKDYEAIKSNPRIGQRKQVSDVVGKAAMRRYTALKSINKTAGEQIDKASQSLKGVRVDVDDEVNNFVSSLEAKGVKIDVSGGAPKISFQGSDFEGLPDGQKPIENIIKRMFFTKEPNAYDVHRLKRYIDNNVSYGVGDKTGAQAEAERMIKGLRHNLDKYLDNVSDAYDKANTRYAATIKPIKEIESLSGKNGVAPRTLGILANRNDSRAVSSGRVAEVFDELDSVSEQMGVRFKDSVSDLHIFANTLDKALPNQRNNSARGQFGRGDIPTSTTDLVVRSGSALVNKVKGVTPQTKLKAMRDLLLSDGSFEKLTAN